VFGKLFSTMYDGTLYGQWEALVTFQQMVILCDREGTVEMTPPALAARTGIPLEIIAKGIEILESPDPYSRSPEEEGRRILRLYDSRPWGWRIVNHAKYREMRSTEDRREYMRQYMQKKRKQSRLTKANGKGVLANVSQCTVSASGSGSEKESVEFPAWWSAESWKEWTAHRRDIRKRMTDRAAKLCQKKLAAYVADGYTMAEVIEHSIANGYTGMYAPNKPRKPQHEPPAARSFPGLEAKS